MNQKFGRITKNWTKIVDFNIWRFEDWNVFLVILNIQKKGGKINFSDLQLPFFFPSCQMGRWVDFHVSNIFGPIMWKPGTQVKSSCWAHSRFFSHFLSIILYLVSILFPPLSCWVSPCEGGGRAADSSVWSAHYCAFRCQEGKMDQGRRGRRLSILPRTPKSEKGNLKELRSQKCETWLDDLLMKPMPLMV